MKPFRYDDLPPALKRQVDRQMTTDRPLRPSDLEPPKPRIVSKPSTRKMTKTEAEYEAKLVAMYGRESVHFEGITLRLANGHRYTPDFVVRCGRDEGIQLFEVKGSYRLHSYGRAKLAFDQARVEWPGWRFVWAEKQPDKTWKET
jgi:hypothetical protein